MADISITIDAEPALALRKALEAVPLGATGPQSIIIEQQAAALVANAFDAAGLWGELPSGRLLTVIQKLGERDQGLKAAELAALGLKVLRGDADAKELDDRLGVEEARLSGPEPSE